MGTSPVPQQGLLSHTIDPLYLSLIHGREAVAVVAAEGDQADFAHGIEFRLVTSPASATPRFAF